MNQRYAVATQKNHLNEHPKEKISILCSKMSIPAARQDFQSVPWVMPHGLGLGGAGGQKFNFLNMVLSH